MLFKKKHNMLIQNPQTLHMKHISTFGVKQNKKNHN